MKLILVIGIILLLGFWAVQVSGRGKPPQAGEPAPEFSLADMDGHMHRLADYRGRWLLLYFYPRADTPGCTRQACALRDYWAEFSRLGVAVLGVSLDAPASLKAFAAKYRLPFPLLSDLSGRTAQGYGSLRDFGVLRLARRNSFLIAPDGRIAKAYLGVDPERHARDVLADLGRLSLEQAGGRANIK